MDVYVICALREKEQAAAPIKNYFDTENLTFVSKWEQLNGINDAIVISHSIVSRLKTYRFAAWDNLYLLFSGIIVSLTEEERLVQERKKAINEKNLRKAKSINDSLIDINFLKRNVCNTAMPNYLQIETTSFCNAACIMCSHYFSENRNAGFLEDITLHHLSDAIQLSHTISLNGMGEPFVSPRLSDQIDFYAAMGNKIVTNTNLSVLNDRLIDQINEHFEWLEISCDGATKDTYEAIRKNLHFDVFLKNLYTLKERCPHVRKHIATVIMRQNVHEMPRMVELASRAGASIITFMTLNSNIIIHNQQDEMCHYPKVLEYYSLRALEMGEKCGIPVIVPNMQELNRAISLEEIEDELSRMKQIPAFKSSQEMKQMKKTASAVTRYLESHDEIQRDTKASDVRCSGICDWLLKQSYIDLDGNAAMCCRNQSFHTGNVNEAGSFSGVWNSDFYQKLREIFYSGSIPESCLKCGLIESGNLKYLKVEITERFYQVAPYKVRQQETLKALLEGDGQE